MTEYERKLLADIFNMLLLARTSLNSEAARELLRNVFEAVMSRPTKKPEIKKLRLMQP